jgi:hypothetical protein
LPIWREERLIDLAESRARDGLRLGSREITDIELVIRNEYDVAAVG